MASLAECVKEMNRVFGNKYGRSNVIALWTVEQLKTFSEEELTILDGLTRETMVHEHRDSQRMMQRLLARIREVKSER